MGFKYELYEERLKQADAQMARIEVETWEWLYKQIYPAVQYKWEAYEEWAKKNPQPEPPKVDPDWGPVTP